MTMTDPIADMLTRIRNAVRARHDTVDVPGSKIKEEIARILKEEGYIRDYSVRRENHRTTIRIRLKYDASRRSVITDIKRVSKPGLRKYVDRDHIPTVLNGLGIAVLTTSRGVMTDRKARQLGVGGEVLCTVY